MGVTRIPACTVSYCPAPTSPEWHKCWVCGAIATEHHHLKPRGMGGSKSRKKDPKNIVALCHSHHEMVTTGGWGCSINHVPGRGLVFWAWDLHGETKAERVLEAESSAVEAGSGSPRPTTHGTQVVPSAALPSVSRAEQVADRAGSSMVERPADNREHTGSNPVRPDSAAASRAESAAAESGRGGAETQRTGLNTMKKPLGHSPGPTGGLAAAPSALVIPGTMTETSLTLPQNLSFEDWTDGVKKLSEFGHHYQFFLGDAIIFGEDRFGEEAWQTLDSLGLQPESIGNIVRVCRAIPPPSRHGALKYSHHVVAYKLDPEERDKWLDVAEANQWGIREFRENVQGKPSRKKRWGLEEMQELLSAFISSVEESLPDAAGEIGQRVLIEYQVAVRQFLDWLEEQGE